ncbi:hypothetical protein NEMIN01_0171 [Nematocida minor]|uniref:uncharacterized protein n=1 Tax=Nematocida minor TaxID=1912983 RepID=UPI002220A498|nr:uncharacterized protein NEMIN01_0067 [Nematocida minor]XP_051332073.1 uncharacterized protein NEMIN01_0171 [Nematocida minor]KAI5188803.1 hypothetical protein NEMIN01_0067 [Nematocida minor]KAI5188907.1 hypothetical protein NEMIN01_0171 [Nematocida minor]
MMKRTILSVQRVCAVGYVFVSVLSTARCFLLNGNPGVFVSTKVIGGAEAAAGFVEVNSSEFLGSDERSSTFHAISEKCLRDLDEYIQRDQKQESSILFDNSRRLNTDLASVYRTLYFLELYGITDKQRNSLMNACMEYDREKIAKAMVDIYTSLVAKESYSIKVKLEGSNDLISTTPSFSVKDTDLQNFICRKMLLNYSQNGKCIDFIERAVGLYAEEEKKVKKTGLYASVEIKKKYSSVFADAKSNTSKEAMPRPENKSVFRPVNRLICPFEEWKKTILRDGYDVATVEIPWSYLDARIFANTDLSFDMAVLEKIINSIIRLENFKELAELIDNPFVEKSAGSISSLLFFLKNCISIYHSSLAERDAAFTLVTKARICSIVLSYIKGTLTPTILQNHLEVLLGDIMHNLIKLQIVKQIEIAEKFALSCQTEIYKKEKSIFSYIFSIDSSLSKDLAPRPLQLPLPSLIISSYLGSKC